MMLRPFSRRLGVAPPRGALRGHDRRPGPTTALPFRCDALPFQGTLVHPDIAPRFVPQTPARITLGTLLDRADAGAFTVTRSVYAAGQVLPPHAHDVASATIVLHGGVTERVSGRRLDCGRDHLLLRPAAVVHSNIYGASGAECVIVGVHNEWVVTDPVARAVFDSPRAAPTAAARVVGGRIRRELATRDHASTLAIEGLVLELVALVARDLHGRRGSVVPAWLRDVRDRLHDDAGASALRLHDVAREAGVHPVYLARAFREWFGCSPGEYVRQRRIDGACAELADTDRSIAEIAMNAGFSSPSHFATMFRRLMGVTPSDFRSRRRDRSRRFRS
jgi:AraC family transcriptional regulator